MEEEGATSRWRGQGQARIERVVNVLAARSSQLATSGALLAAGTLRGEGFAFTAWHLSCVYSRHKARDG